MSETFRHNPLLFDTQDLGLAPLHEQLGLDGSLSGVPTAASDPDLHFRIQWGAPLLAQLTLHRLAQDIQLLDLFGKHPNLNL